MTWEVVVLLASSGERPGMLLNGQQCTGWLLQHRIEVCGAEIEKPCVEV